MRVLVTGARGMLGHDLVPALRGAGYEVTAAGRRDLDIGELGACAEAVAGHAAVINLAAWTRVDDAEEQEADAFVANATGAANLARAASASGARLVHMSTDYVFDGSAQVPYAEDAPVGPRSAYGRTKAAGEWAVRALCPQSWIVRTAWLYGAGGPNFLATMAGLAQKHETLTVVDDQRGQPTWTGDLAAQVVALLGSEAAYGIYHGTAQGRTTWFGLTRALFEELGLDPERVQPTTSAEFPRPAPRPAWSVLGHEAWRSAGVALQPDWRVSLRAAVPELGLPGA